MKKRINMPDDKEKVETEVLNVKEQIFYQDKPIEEVIEDIAGSGGGTPSSDVNSYFPSGW